MLNAASKRLGGRSLIIYALLISFFAVVLLYHLGSTPSFFSIAESAARNSASSFKDVYYNPINAPHKLLLLGIEKAGFHGWAALRLSSVIPAVIFGLSFYTIVRSWFGKTIGLFGTLIFVCTPIFIITARSASPQIMLFSSVAVMALYNWLLKTNGKKNSAFFWLIVAAGLAIYTPGVLWWVLFAAIVSWKRISSTSEDIPIWVIGLSFGVLLLLLLPLGAGIARNWHYAQQLLLIPNSWHGPVTIIKNLAWAPLALIIKTPHSSLFFVGNLAVINIIQLTMLVFGIFAMYSAAKSKTITLCGAILLGVLISGLNNDLALLIFCLPAIGIFVTAGLRYLYIEWRSVFPINPIPKSLAFCLMLAIVSISCAYGLSYSLNAWPHSLSTNNTYMLK